MKIAFNWADQTANCIMEEGGQDAAIKPCYTMYDADEDVSVKISNSSSVNMDF